MGRGLGLLRRLHCRATAAEAVTDDGTLIWELAEKRVSTLPDPTPPVPSSVNVKILAEFIAGRDLIINAMRPKPSPSLMKLSS